jgi:ribosomal protein S18 acetylase RimI-like enzyme
MIRDARPSEFAEIGSIRVAAYVSGGFMSPSSDYAPSLAALGTAGDGQILVAEAGGQLLGTVMLQPLPQAGPVARENGEAEIRALAVAPDGQGRGTGRALLQAVISRAAQEGVRQLVLCTQPDMLAAQHLYQRAGFARLPERDRSPVAGLILLAYGLTLPAQ